MDWFTKLVVFLEGKKTYLVVLAGLISLLVTWLNHGVTNGDAVKDFFALILTMTMRMGISQNGIKSLPPQVKTDLATLITEEKKKLQKN